MPELHWQKSTYSQEASACVYLATTPTGTILLRESDEPEAIVSIGTGTFAALITHSKHVHKEALLVHALFDQGASSWHHEQNAPLRTEPPTMQRAPLC
ncbi:DUF397 domain-containing protein [Streptomyces sp. NPDC006872]|uniref:DUF397 domain-containing protein n=1 Tax=Streptomyces sp. NPDC006872 TaxID=3155720 RepID=UPI0033C3AE0F